MAVISHHHRSNIRSNKRHSRVRMGVENKAPSISRAKSLNKSERKNNSKQRLRLQQIENIECRRFFRGKYASPKFVAVIPLSENIDPTKVLMMMNSAVPCQMDNFLFDGCLKYPSCKQRLKFIVPPRSFSHATDAAKLADYIVLLLPTNENVSRNYENLLRAIHSQGSVTPIVAACDLRSAGSPKDKERIIKSLKSYINFFYPESDKIYDIESFSDSAKVINHILSTSPKIPKWKQFRSYLLPFEIEVEPDGIFSVSAVIRGQNFDPTCPIHVSGAGSFAILSVSTVQSKNSNVSTQKIIRSVVEGEQILNPWADAPRESESARNVRKSLPRSTVRVDGTFDVLHDHITVESPGNVEARSIGTSEYQAAWLDYNSEETHSSQDFDMKECNDDSEEIDRNINIQDDKIDVKGLKKLVTMEKEDKQFPDEIQLDPMERARERLGKYRGMLNIKEEKWDTQESDDDTPVEYSRITGFKNVDNKRYSSNSKSSESIQAGTLISFKFHPRNCSSLLFELFHSGCLGFFSLYDQECKYSHVIVRLLKHSEFEAPIKSKVQLMVQLGFKRYIVNPIFSENNIDDEKSNVLKYERFLHGDKPKLAHFIGTPLLTRDPVLVWQKQLDGDWNLVAQGTNVGTHDAKVIVKRIVLTGHPSKAHKKLTTIRHMFHNPEDVKWFKPVPLYTRNGARGFIKESLGERGDFKATFNKRIKIQDTVAMDLYKRVYPKIVDLQNCF